jgi:long-chain acyl-CoA synthetase
VAGNNARAGRLVARHIPTGRRPPYRPQVVTHHNYSSGTCVVANVDGPARNGDHDFMPNLALALSETAAMYPSHPAIRLEKEDLSYAELDRASARVASLLRSRGFEPGDRVGVMLPNVPQFAVVYYGVLRAGGVVVPMNPLLKEREVDYYVQDSGARFLFAWHQVSGATTDAARAAGAELIEVAPDEFERSIATLAADPDIATRAGEDTAVILYTSGTTGHPKGAELTHFNLTRNAQVTATTLLELDTADVILGCLPFFHAFGQTCCLNAAIQAGSTLTLMSRFDPSRALDIMASEGVTVFEGVPTMYAALLEQQARQPRQAKSLRVCISGGAALPVETLRRFDETFHCAILEGYGLSETSPVASFNHPGRQRKAGSIGTPIAGVEFRLIDDDGRDVPPGEPGEIAIRGHNVMKGYWHKPDETAAAFDDGWFRTGDIARVDGDGYYYIVDRKKDLIIRGGFNVYPREVEEVLYEHPAVLEAAVIGLPHESLGEEIGAAVALREGHSASPEELQQFVKARLAAYKYPRQVWLVDRLPQGPTGKIMRRLVTAPGETSAT